jgi:hypothetical protein
MQNPPPTEQLSPATVLAILAEALSDIPDRIADIEVHAEALAATAPGDARVRVAIQDLDLIRQTIEDLARLAAAAAGDGDGKGAHSARLAETLRLGALRSRLPGRAAAGAPGPADLGDPGEVDFFATGSRAG